MSEMQKRSERIKRLVIDAMLVGIFVVLSLYASVDVWVMKFTFNGIAIILAALLFGLKDACAVAILGAFLEQLLTYGLSVTTPLWILPALCRALLVGGYAQLVRFRYRPLVMMAVVVASSVLVTVVNTGVMWLDSVIMGYYSFAYVFGKILPRFGAGIITALLYGGLTMALLPRVSALGSRAVLLLPEKKSADTENE